MLGSATRPRGSQAVVDGIVADLEGKGIVIKK